MKFIKKNQVIVGVICLMLIVAGYLNFTNNSQINSNKLLEVGALADSEQMASIGDAQLVSTSPADEDNSVNSSNESNENKENTNNNTISNTTKEQDIQTSSLVTTDEYFTKSRLERETMYSQTIETYQKILEKTNVSESQKMAAQKEIQKINEQKNAIMIAENLIKTKGFEDIIIFVNEGSVNAIIKSKSLKSEQIAQIQNIVTRELKTTIENIHISNKE